ncbi:MAG: hypothetical protein A3F18_03385 [Legionellales bacterium RIFCSPHIGHO2_12_FULL_37_14]|nr:MAG: hypothetical protein A3F18_03385 [Legionellales bacterium RIFCSPHIGHO2_12_FULL_37_14]
MHKELLNPILYALKRGAWVITPNKHLAHVILQHFFAFNKVKVQVKPQCLPYQTFMQIFYDSLIQESPQLNHPRLLTDILVKYLWQKARSSQHDALTIPYSSFQICKLWGVDLEDPLFKSITHTNHFAKQAKTFNKYLRELHAITNEMVMPYILNNIQSLPFKEIIFACFDDFTKQQVSLGEFLDAKALPWDKFDLPLNPSLNYQYAAKDEQTELLAFANWAHENLANAPIALLVPDMEQKAQQLKNWFLYNFPNLEIYFSLGKALSSYPIVQHALLLLFLHAKPFDLLKAKQLLHTPFIGCSQDENEARANIACNHPLLKSRFITLKQFISALTPSCPYFVNIISNLSSYPKKASAHEWGEIFLKRLIECKFPGNCALNDETMQVYQRFIDLIVSFKELHVLNSCLSRDEAFNFLTHILDSCLFQARQNINAPIHVLGLMEASGSPYAKIWIMNFSRENYPAFPKPNIFIPLKIAQKYKLPHTNLQHEHMLNHKRFNRFKNAASLLNVSYPKQTAKGEQSPSPFIANFSLINLDAIAKHQVSTREIYQDPKFIPLAATEELSKSSRLLGEQAKCPFRAFAAIRLKLEPLEPLNSGVTAKIRGILLHKILEIFWRQVKSQAMLKSLEEAALHKLIHNCAVKAFAVSSLHHVQKDLQNLEVNRLKKLLLASLEWEKARPDYKISALESSVSLKIGPLNLNVRLDRLDCVTGGEKWVIDYKTTAPSPLPWTQERPLDVQILLYALAYPEIRAVIFYELKHNKALIKGLSANPYPSLPLTLIKDSASWENKSSQWQAYLVKLAEDFFRGRCEARPDNPYLCKTCEFKVLCRFPLLEQGALR